MHHVAILDKKRKLLDKIISGEKTIESRWYRSKRAPWNRIKEGDVVYFKNSGEPVRAMAGVERIMQFSSLDRGKIKEILESYGEAIGIPREKIEAHCAKHSEKKYCILVFLRDVQLVEPFNVDKTGFGIMSAWMSTKDISTIALRPPA